jgi:Ca-activated chloride channel family protein
MKAAALAKELSVRIYTIGVGAEQMLMQTSMGQRLVNRSEDLDEKTLDAIAQETGGRYFRAKDTSGLASVYKQLDRLEPVSADPVYVRPSISLFYWPLAAAMLISMAMALSMLMLRITVAVNARTKAPGGTKAPASTTGQMT